MHELPYDVTAPKKPVNLRANSDLVRSAKAVDLNLSQLFEEAVSRELRKRLGQQWLAENRAGIADYNNHIEEHGAFSAGKRRF
ncbi:MAG: acetoacetyl-CoA synthase [Geobacter sp.]|nr:acetoacetyl-CoA synthase [Geobacter sp.]